MATQDTSGRVILNRTHTIRLTLWQRLLILFGDDNLEIAGAVSSATPNVEATVTIGLLLNGKGIAAAQQTCSPDLQYHVVEGGLS